MLAASEYTLYGTYVLRGSESLLALGEILALTKPVPLQQPAISFEPEDRGEVAGADAEALMQWLAEELGASTVQVYLENAYLHSTDLRPYKVAARLMKLAAILNDEGGTRLAALTDVINEFVEAGTLPSDEQMLAVLGRLQQHSGDTTTYGAAGEWLEALASYVGILSSEMGWATDKSVSFVMGKYGTAAAEGGNVSVMAFIQMHVEAM
jgi:predicted nucleic acid-binding protein